MNRLTILALVLLVPLALAAALVWALGTLLHTHAGWTGE